MVHIADFLAESFSSPVRWSTGLKVLDELLGGMGPRQLWLVTGSPGEGKSTLLIQLAFRMAMDHEADVWFAAPLEDADLVRARLLALAGAGSLRYPDPGVVERRTLVDRVNELRRSKFDVQVGGGFRCPEWPAAEPEPRCWAVDDAQYAGQAFAGDLRSAADDGAFVVASLPRAEVIAGPDGASVVVQHWASVADVIIEIQSGVSKGRAPGDAQLLVHRNRRGPRLDLTITNQVWWGRFVDCPQ